MQKLKNILVCVLGLLMFSAVQAQPKIARVEYYIDNDPGYGKGKGVSNISGNDISNKTISITIDTLKAGVHILGIRAKDSLGAWSLDNSWVFYKPDTIKKPVPNITQIEYYIDKDPGYNKGIQVAIEAAKDFPNVNLFINIATLKTGQHKIGIRSKDGNGRWGLDNVDSFTVGSVVAGPSITTASISSKTICAGGQVKVGYQKQGTFDSANKFIVQLSNSLGAFTNPKEIGSITTTGNGVVVCNIPPDYHGNNFKVRVISTSPKDTSANTIDSITINTSPGKPIINSNIPVTNVCLKDKVILTSSVNAASYKWNRGDTTKSITVDTTGSFTVTVFNATGCSATSDTTKVVYLTCARLSSPVTATVTATTAVLKWKAVKCAVSYKIQYRINGAKFTTINNVTDTSYTLTGLTPDTGYQWRVAAVCRTSPLILSDYTPLVSFTTTTAFAANKTIDAKQTGKLQAGLFPNPTNDKAFVSVKNAKGNVQIILFDMNGKELWRSNKVFSENVSIPVNKLANGNYVVRVADKESIIVLKLIKE